MSDDLLKLPWSIQNEQLYQQICSSWKDLDFLLDTWIQSVSTHRDYQTWPYEEKEGQSLHEYGPSFDFSSYWVAVAMIHYFAARILLYDALNQAVCWKIERSGFLSSPRTSILADWTSPISAEHQLAHDVAILQALDSILSLCADLVQQIQDVSARSVLKCMRYMHQEKWGTISLLIPSSSALCIAAKHLKRIGAMEELGYC